MTHTPARLMVIDDEERIRTLLLDFFEDFDELAVRTCESAEAALEELARESADLCIVDMRLPGMNGQDFIVAALARGLCPHHLLHTGSMDFILGETLISRNVTDRDVFLKPCDMGEMLSRIREILKLPGA